jgi:hypothetical protein
MVTNGNISGKLRRIKSRFVMLKMLKLSLTRSLKKKSLRRVFDFILPMLS